MGGWVIDPSKRREKNGREETEKETYRILQTQPIQTGQELRHNPPLHSPLAAFSLLGDCIHLIDENNGGGSSACRGEEVPHSLLRFTAHSTHHFRS